MTSTSLDTLAEPLLAAWSRLQQRVGTERLLALLNLAVVALLAWSMAGWTWRLLQPNLPQVVAEAASTRSAGPAFDPRLILDAHLFGKAPAPEVTKNNLNNVPLSSLNLVLTGVVAAGDDGIALISVSGQPQMPYAIGDMVSHGAVLYGVYPDRAILQRNGVLESLILEDVAKSLPNKSVVNMRPSSTRQAAARIRTLGNNNFALPRNLIGEQLKNPDFLRQAHIVGRKDGGFLVRKLKKGSLYEKLGLRQGDVIKSVNGEPINTIEDAMRQYQQLNTAGQVQVEVLRNGQPQMLQFHLE